MGTRQGPGLDAVARPAEFPDPGLEAGDEPADGARAAEGAQVQQRVRHHLPRPVERYQPAPLCNTKAHLTLITDS